jgi:hypothetical protein
MFECSHFCCYLGVLFSSHVKNLLLSGVHNQCHDLSYCFDCGAAFPLSQVTTFFDPPVASKT